MKRIKVLILSMFLTFCVTNGLFSQAITNYVFSATSGTFTALSGTTTQLLAANADEASSVNNSIGFDFWYMGNRCTVFSVCDNGYMNLGAALTSTNANNLASGGNRPVIAPLWDDLKTDNTIGKVHCKLSGAAPNRVMTIEWLNMRWDWTATGPCITFQVKLYETSGMIEFVYRQDATAPDTPSASIGITASGTGSGNFLSLNGTGASPIASSTAETANLTVRPATGQIYAFTPPVTSPPTNLTFDCITKTSMTLNWTNNGSNRVKTAIYRSIDNITFTYINTVAAAVNSFNATGLTTGTNYYWNLYSVSEGYTGLPLNGSQVTQLLNVTSSGSSACRNTPVTLTLGAGYLGSIQWQSSPNGSAWSDISGATGNPYISPPITATIYFRAKVTNGTCLDYSNSVMIIVNPNGGTMTTSAVGDTVCNGNTINLTSTGSAGLRQWQSSPDGITWSDIAGASSTPYTTAPITDTIYFRAKLSNGTCPDEFSNVKSIRTYFTPVTPGAISGTAAECAGTSYTYSISSVPDATTYTWVLPTGDVATAGGNGFNFVTFNAANSGTITVTAGNNCGTSPTSSLVVTVTNIPPAPAGSITGPATVCSDNTYSYNIAPVTGATSYIWAVPAGSTVSTGQGSTNVDILFGTTSGTISVTPTNGCNGTAATLAVTVNPSPAAPTAGSDSPVCAGSTLNLTATTVTGATAYNWTGPNGFTASTQNASISGVTTLASGTYSVTAFQGGCNGVAGTVAVTVNELPAAPTASSNSPLCEGTTLNLTADPVAGATYSWTGPDGFTSTDQNPAVSNVTTAASGTYSVTVSVNGCTGPAGTTAVTVNAAPATPTAASNSPLCNGATLNLTANTVAGATYSWTGPNSFVSSDQNPSIPNASTAESGTYAVTVTENGCASNAGTTAVTVVPLPSAPSAGNNSPLCEGTTLFLTADTVAGATYSWTGPNGFSSSMQNPSIPAVTSVESGTYSVTITTNGCTSNPATTNVVVDPPPSAPSAGGNSPLCEGTTLFLTADTVAGAAYSWTGPNGFSSSMQNPSIPAITSTESGTYSVAVTINGCTSSAATTNVAVVPSPSAPIAGSNSPLCSGSTLDLTADTVAGATYSWTGPNGFSSSLQNPSIPAATSAESGIYSVTISLNGCTSGPATTNVVVDAPPSAPAAGSNSPLCEGTTLLLTADTVAGATYSWTGPNGFSSSMQNPSIPAATSAESGTYSLTITINSCTSSPATTNVVVDPPPSAPSAGSNSPLCEGTTLNLTASTIAGATYSWTGPNGFSSSMQNPSIAAATSTESGTYSVTVVINGCTSNAATTNVVVDPSPSAPTAGSNSPLCSGSTLDLTADTIAGASYSWIGPNGFSSSIQNPSIPSASPAESGTYSVTVTINGCTSSPGMTNVNVVSSSTPPTAGSNSPLCEGTTLFLTADTVSGATYSWTGPNGFTSSLQNPSIPAATSAESGTYSLTITINGCTSSPAILNVSVVPPPAAPVAGNNSPLCEGTTLILTVDTVAGAAYGWTGPNGFSSTMQNPSIAAATSAESGTYSVTVTMNGCTSSPATTSVVVDPAPSAPTAGSNSPLCSGSTLDLTTDTVAGAAYSWTGPNGFSSSLQNPSIPGATPTESGTYSVTVTINGCTSSPATTNVIVFSPPSAPTAGNNGPLCEGTTLTLTADTVAGATYSWTGPNGFSSSLQNPSISGVTPAESGAYSVSIELSGCVSNSAVTNVVVEPSPTPPMAASNSPLCEGTTLMLSADTVAGATYSWTGPNGFSSSLQNPSIPSATTVVAGTYSVTVTINGCASTPATTTVVVDPAPVTPVASSNSPVCVGDTLNLFAGSIPSATYSWSGPNGFSDVSQNPAITNVTGAASGTYSVTASFGSCTSAEGTVMVTINATPVAPVASGNSPVCAGGILNLFADTIPGANYSWSGPNGFISSAQNEIISNVQPAAAGTYTVVADNGCASSPSTITVVINSAPPAPSITAVGPAAFCQGDSVQLISSVENNYLWSNGATTQATYVSASGNYDVTVTDLNGCTAVSAPFSVTVNQLPVVSFTGLNPGYCLANSAAPLTGTPSGGTFSGPGIIGNTFDPVMAGTGMHTISYFYSDTNGCSGSETQNTVVSMNAFVNLGPDTILCDDATPYDLSAGLFSSYVWQDFSTNATFSVDAVALGIGIHSIHVNVTDTNGCTAVDSVVVEVSDCDGFENQDELLFHITPNPATGIISLQFGKISGPVTIDIMDVQGQLIMNGGESVPGNARVEMDLSSLAKGIYFIRVDIGEMSSIQKLILN